MNPIFARFIAVLLLVIPGALATYGFLEMKNALFNYFASYGDEEAVQAFEWFRMIIGLLSFGIGISFIGGWIFFRDRKRNYLQPKFMKKK